MCCRDAPASTAALLLVHWHAMEVFGYIIACSWHSRVRLHARGTSPQGDQARRHKE